MTTAIPLNPLPNQFSLADYRVDTTRGELSLNGQTIAIEPKVMEVLILLSQCQGQVVSQEKIFAAVWPNSIFSPSSVQRCITVLRKSLGDDAKQQKYIVTHPKRGYSLKVPIGFLAPVVPVSPNAKKRRPAPLIALTFGLLLLALTVWTMYGASPSPQKDTFVVGELTPLTASQNNEHFGRMSRDNRYLAFIRSTAGGKQSVWLKELSSQQQMELTVPSGEPLQSLAWSTDSKALMYVEQTGSSFRLNRLTLNAPDNLFVTGQKLKPTPILSLSDLKYISPIYWSASNEIVYIGWQSEHGILYRHNLTTGEHHQLLAHSPEFSPYALTVSDDGQHIALAGFNPAMETLVQRFAPQDNTRTALAHFPPGLYELAWHPSNNSLLVSDGQQLTLLSLDGSQLPINFGNIAPLHSPHFSHHGQGISFTREITDADIWHLPLNDSLRTPTTPLIDSNTRDRSPSLSASGEHLAFISERAGHSQLFVHDINTASQRLVYANEDRNQNMTTPQWSPDDRQLAIAADGQLQVIDMTNGTRRSIPTTVYIDQGLQWFHHQDAVLVDYLEDGIRWFGRLELHDGQLEPIQQAHRYQGLLTPDDTLLLVNKTGITNPQGNELLPPLSQGQSIHQAISKTEGIYYSVQEEDRHELWFVSHSSGEKHQVPTLIRQLPAHVSFDIDPEGQSLLLEQQQINMDILLLRSAKK